MPIFYGLILAYLLSFIMNFIEEIGTEKRIDEVTQVEPKTD